MLHRHTLIAICAVFCAIAVGAGLFVANLSRQSGLITQQADINGTSLPTSVNATAPTQIVDEPTAANTPVPTSAPIAALDPGEPTATSRPTPTSVPVATVAPTSDTAAFIEYTVQKGDVLKDIARRYNVTTKDILAINQIRNADSLTVGQVLRIPKI
jgi:LysM repeat protein